MCTPGTFCFLVLRSVLSCRNDAEYTIGALA